VAEVERDQHDGAGPDHRHKQRVRALEHGREDEQRQYAEGHGERDQRHDPSHPADDDHRQREHGGQEVERDLPVDVRHGVLEVVRRLWRVGQDDSLFHVKPSWCVRLDDHIELPALVLAALHLDRRLLAASAAPWGGRRRCRPGARTGRGSASVAGGGQLCPVGVAAVHRHDAGHQALLRLLVEAHAGAVVGRRSARPQQHEPGDDRDGERDQYRRDDRTEVAGDRSGRSVVMRVPGGMAVRLLRPAVGVTIREPERPVEFPVDVAARHP
jgi:hypothetical protein